MDTYTRRVKFNRLGGNIMETAKIIKDYSGDGVICIPDDVIHFLEDVGVFKDEFTGTIRVSIVVEEDG